MFNCNLDHAQVAPTAGPPTGVGQKQDGTTVVSPSVLLLQDVNLLDQSSNRYSVAQVAGAAVSNHVTPPTFAPTSDELPRWMRSENNYSGSSRVETDPNYYPPELTSGP